MKLFLEKIHFKKSVYYSINYWTSVILLLAVSLLVSIMQVLIKSVYPMQNVYFLKFFHQKARSSKFWKNVIRMQYWFHLLQHRLTLPQLSTMGNIYLLHLQVRGNVFPQSYVHHFVFLNGKFVMLKWNGGNWKLKMIFILVTCNKS